MAVASSTRNREMAEEVYQLTAWISGHVQGVYFRATTENVSRQFEVTGRVKNLPDGRVWIFAEGSEAEVQAFLGQVREVKRDNITDVETEVSAGPREYGEFAVSY